MNQAQYRAIGFTAQLTLTLFVLRILADDPNAAFSLNNLAFLADRFYRRSNFHWYTLLSQKSPHIIIAPVFNKSKRILWDFFRFLLVICLSR